MSTIAFLVLCALDAYEEWGGDEDFVEKLYEGIEMITDETEHTKALSHPALMGQTSAAALNQYWRARQR